MILHFDNHTVTGPGEDFFATVLQNAVQLLELDPATEVGLTLVDDVEMRALNKRWRSKNSPTDVLSFTAEKNMYPYIGDIIIDSLYVEQNLHEYSGNAWRAVFEHALLHLLGHDHATASGRLQMDALAARLGAKELI